MRTLVAIVVALASVGAASATDPVTPVREAFRLDRKTWEAFPDHAAAEKFRKEQRAFFSRRLVELLAADETCSVAAQAICNLDWDPVSGGQDVVPEWFDNLKFDLVDRHTARASVRARFGPPEVWKQARVFEVVVEDGRWVIDDIREGMTSLRALLSRPSPSPGAEAAEAAVAIRAAVEKGDEKALIALVHQAGMRCGRRTVLVPGRNPDLHQEADLYALVFDTAALRERLRSERPVLSFRDFFAKAPDALLHTEFVEGQGWVVRWTSPALGDVAVPPRFVVADDDGGFRIIEIPAESCSTATQVGAHPRP